MKYLEYANHLNAQESVKLWVSSNLANHLKKNSPDQGEVEHIIDYLVSKDAPKRLERMSYDQAKSNADKWMKKQIKKGNSIDETPEDTTTVLELDNGFKWVELIGENAYKRKGFLMSHCVGSYFEKDVKIYSLRDKDNMLHCTVEKDQQIKGKGNGSIHPKYIGMVVEFLEWTGMEVRDSEMKNLGYFQAEKYRKYLSDKSWDLNYKGYLPITVELKDREYQNFFHLDLISDIGLIDGDGKVLLPLKDLDKGVELAIKECKCAKLEKTTSGYSAKLASSGDYAQLASSGYSAKLASSGDYAQLASSGDYAQLASSGYYAQLASSGYSAKLASSGYSAKLASSGDYAQLASSGDYAQLEINGKNSVGANIGINGKIKGSIGNWITLAEYNDDNEVVFVSSTQIDGKEILADTWYKLSNKKFIEVK